MNNKSEVQAATANNSSIVTIKYMPAKNLRDEFAMAALQGILARPESPAEKDAKSEVAEQCYFYADAMLRARGE